MCLFDLGFIKTFNQTNILKYVHALHFTLTKYIVPKGPELCQLEDIIGGGPKRKVKWLLIRTLVKLPKIFDLNLSTVKH